MRKNKLWGLLIVLVVSVGLLSGCSQAEMGMIDLMGEMNDLNTFETQETVSLKINRLPSDLTKSDPAATAIAQSLASRYLLKSEIRMDANKQVFDGTYYLIDSASGTQKPLLSYVGAGGTIYVKVDDLASFAKTLGNKQISKHLAILGDAQYISINEKEMASLMLMNTSGSQPSFNLTDIKKQQELYDKLMNTLTKEAYKDYETGMVKRNGNKYTLTVDKESVLNNIEPFMVYTINNAEKINAAVTKFLLGLDDEELAMMSLTPQMRTTAIDEMAKAAKDAASNREKHLAAIKGLAEQAEQGSGMIGDKTGMTIVVEKLAADNYKQTTQLALQISDPDNPADSLDVSLDSNAEVKGIDPFTVTIPNSGVISFSELQERMPRSMMINTTSKQYIFNQGIRITSSSVDVRILQGRTYLPARTIGEVMKEKVGWNPATKEAYILRDGKSINLKTTVLDGQAFIQIRDFEKLGYKVTWDNASKTVTLSQ